MNDPDRNTRRGLVLLTGASGFLGAKCLLASTPSSRIRLRERLSAWARLHPVVAFVLLTYAISWGFCLVAPALAAGDTDIQRQISNLAVFGPALAATAVSAMCGLASASVSCAARATIFTVVLVGGSLIWYLTYRFVPEAQMRPGLWWLRVLSAAIAAYVIASRLSPWRGPQGLLARLTQWRLGLRWNLLAILLWPFLWVLDGALTPLLGLEPSAASPLLSDPKAWLRFLLWAGMVLLYGGGLEEPGWRGFALPQLQRRYSPLVATIIVGLMWAVWHGPIYYGVSVSAAVMILPMALSTTAMGFLYTWVYNGSGGSLITLVLLHTMTNAVGSSFLPSGPLPRGLAALIGIVLIFVARMWRKGELV